MVAMVHWFDPVGVAEDLRVWTSSYCQPSYRLFLEELGFDPSVEREFDFDRTRIGRIQTLIRYCSVVLYTSIVVLLSRTLQYRQSRCLLRCLWT